MTACKRTGMPLIKLCNRLSAILLQETIAESSKASMSLIVPQIFPSSIIGNSAPLKSVAEVRLRYRCRIAGIAKIYRPLAAPDSLF
jgi:hypothetical protein